jgi:hypothetical protein
VIIVDAREYLDGGTTYVVLKDSKGRLLWMCVSQYMNEGGAPANTLFLDATHPDQELARLPLTSHEATLIIDSLQSAVELALSPQDREAVQSLSDVAEEQIREQFTVPEKKRRSPEKWKAIYAFDALRRLQEREQIEVRNAEGTNAPDWYADFAAARNEELVRQEQQRRAEGLFLSYFPEDCRGLFKLPPGSGPNPEELEQQQGKRLAAAVGDPADLAIMCCRALGTRDDWSGKVTKDRIAIAAVKTVAGPELLKAFEKLPDEPLSKLGAARVYFALGGAKLLSDNERAKLGVRLAEAVLESNLESEKLHVVGYIGRLTGRNEVEFLWRVGRGEVGREPAAKHRREPGLQATALLTLAARREPTVKNEIERRLTASSGQDRTAYEVSLAVLGDPSYVKRENFDTESYQVAFAAIRAIEQFEGREGMDVLFEAGLEHPWAAVRNESLLAIQRLTGQAWYKDDDRNQPGNFAKEAQAWWKQNRDEFLAKHAKNERKSEAP